MIGPYYKQCPILWGFWWHLISCRSVWRYQTATLSSWTTFNWLKSVRSPTIAQWVGVHCWESWSYKIENYMHDFHPFIPGASVCFLTRLFSWAQIITTCLCNGACSLLLCSFCKWVTRKTCLWNMSQTNLQYVRHIITIVVVVLQTKNDVIPVIRNHW